MEKIFGTDGIRGLANSGTLQIQFLLKIVPAIVDKYRPKKIIIGKDSRISGDMLVYALSSIFNSYGVNVVTTGLISTPALAYVTLNNDFDLGIMVSASHNPYQDNGIKIFNRNGVKLSENEEAIISDMVNLSTAKLATHSSIGTTINDFHLVDQYKDYVVSAFKHIDISNYKIVVDCANGSLSYLAQDILSEFSNNIVYTATTPNGVNINDNCGVMYPNSLAGEVTKQEADFGIAFDGDGDRVLFCDEKGKIVDGDQLIGFIAKELPNIDTVAVTKISNFALDQFLSSIDIKTTRTEVGDKYITQEIIAKKAQIGGEKSGHIIVDKKLKTGDGLVSALSVMEHLATLSGPASTNLRPFELYPSLQKNIATQDKAIVDTKEFKEFLAAYSNDQHTRVLVRKSGTENVIRVLVEGQDVAKLNKILEEIEQWLINTLKLKQE